MTSGWRGSTRSARLPSDWPHRRATCRARAGGRCEHRDPHTGLRCPAPGSECDHRVPGDDHSITNLQWLCEPHHRAKTITERPRPRSARRTVEPTPGLID